MSSPGSARLPLGWCHVPSDHAAHAYVYMGVEHWCRGSAATTPKSSPMKARRMTKKEAARQLAIIASEVRAALDGTDDDCPTWADDLIAVADALDPSGFVDEGAAREDLAQIKRLEHQRDSAITSLNAWERACHDSDARLAAVVEHVGAEVADPVIRRVDEGLARDR